MRKISFLRLTLGLLSWGITPLAIAQINEDFSDGDFTSNPTWSGGSNFGTSDPFEIVEADNQLRSQDVNSGRGTRIMYLTTPDVLDLSSSIAQWSFRIRLSFNIPGSASTNSNNTSRVYLMSNSPDLTTDIDGFLWN